MCPFCISTVVSVAAGAVTTAGVASLFAFARRIPDSAGDETSCSESPPTRAGDEQR